MNEPLKATGTLGTAAVFLTAISTILGAIMFLRFGYAVAHVGFIGTLAIILIGHAVTIPTAMALAEIATNQKVEGGGEYYIISRTFGLIPGAAIGISLFLSQADQRGLLHHRLLRGLPPGLCLAGQGQQPADQRCPDSQPAGPDYSGCGGDLQGRRPRPQAALWSSRRSLPVADSLFHRLRPPEQSR